MSSWWSFALGVVIAVPLALVSQWGVVLVLGLVGGINFGLLAFFFGMIPAFVWFVSGVDRYPVLGLTSVVILVWLTAEGIGVILERVGMTGVGLSLWSLGGNRAVFLIALALQAIAACVLVRVFRWELAAHRKSKAPSR